MQKIALYTNKVALGNIMFFNKTIHPIVVISMLIFGIIILIGIGNSFLEGNFSLLSSLSKFSLFYFPSLFLVSCIFLKE